MNFTAVIEQTYRHRKRMKYIAATRSFIEKEGDSLGYVKNVPYPYGWIKESGTPPQPHLDIYIITDKEFELGDEVPVSIIGVFRRTDNDHKLVGILNDRNISDFAELTQKEKDDLSRLYLGKYEGEGWYGKEEANRIIKEFFTK